MSLETETMMAFFFSPANDHVPLIGMESNSGDSLVILILMWMDASFQLPTVR